MIELKIDGKGYEVSQELRDDIEARLGGLDEHMDALEHGHVTVSWEGGEEVETMVHAQLWGPRHRFHASEANRVAMAAVAKISDKLATQIRREHRKEVSGRRHG